MKDKHRATDHKSLDCDSVQTRPRQHLHIIFWNYLGYVYSCSLQGA